MDWETVLKYTVAAVASFGGVAAIVIAIVRFSCERIVDALFMKYEQRLKKELETVKSNNDRKVYISKARFDKEFAMYQELSEAHMTMVYDMGAAVILSRGGKHPNYDTVTDFIHDALEHIDSAEMMNKRYAPFISKDIFERYKELGERSYQIISRLDLWYDMKAHGYLDVKFNGENYTQERTKAEIEERQKELSRLSDDTLDFIREYLSRLDSLEG